ncbi:hypothetical protein ACOMHN_052248 [Nucella lapillus]
MNPYRSASVLPFSLKETKPQKPNTQSITRSIVDRSHQEEPESWETADVVVLIGSGARRGPCANNGFSILLSPNRDWMTAPQRPCMVDPQLSQDPETALTGIPRLLLVQPQGELLNGLGILQEMERTDASVNMLMIRDGDE